MLRGYLKKPVYQLSVYYPAKLGSNYGSERGRLSLALARGRDGSLVLRNMRRLRS